MGLAIRIIPILLHKNGSLVKGKQFNSWRVVGHPLQAARIHSIRGVDELMILDIGSDSPNIKMTEALTESSFMPITVGGGIQTIKNVRDLLNAGADKVCIKSKSVIKETAKHFGNQSVCVSLDDDINPQELEDLGAGEILLQSIKRDGMMNGYDVDRINNVSELVNIPVIASCGCGSYKHMLEAINAGASAVAVGAFFQFTDATPLGAAQYLNGKGITVRY